MSRDVCGKCEWNLSSNDMPGCAHIPSVPAQCRACARRLAAENARLRGQVKKLEGLITDWATDKGWTPEEGFADMRGAAVRIIKRQGRG